MNILIKKYDKKYFSLAFTDSFTSPMLDAVRKINGRKWSDKDKTWLVPNLQKCVDELLRNLYSTGLFEYEPDDEKIILLPHSPKKILDYSSVEKGIISILEKVQNRLKARNYSQKTIDRYKKWVEVFLLKYGLGSDVGQTQINEFLTKLAVKDKVSPSTQNQALSALLFYFRFVRNEDPTNFSSVIHAKIHQRIPVVFSVDEVRRVIKCLPESKQLLVELLYGTGMRLNELVCLRILDLDFERYEIIVRHGKGNKDRHVMLPSSLIPKLKEHIATVKYIHQKDLNDGWGNVALPNQIAQKYPAASTEFKWQWLFPQKTRWINPQTGAQGRYHIHASLLQKAVKQAIIEAGINKNASCHTFRHSFATHLLENGYDIRTIQELLGHNNVQTTMIYTHVLNKGPSGVISPIDKL